MNSEQIQQARYILAAYDALPNWTMTEVRYLQVALECSESRALKLTRAARKANAELRAWYATV